MILPDVNVLLYAFDESSPFHAVCAPWLQRIVDGDDELALADHCLLGLLRIATNPRAVEFPAPASDVMTFVERLRGARRQRAVGATAMTWKVLASLIDGDRSVKGNLIPDAYLAALAMSHGCRLATGDRGFGRFPGLDFFDPTRP